MSLGLALKNTTSLVVAADHGPDGQPSPTSHFFTLHNRTVVVVSGLRAAIEPLLFKEVVPKVREADSTAAVVQYMYSELLLKVVPKRAQLVPGRVEILVAGIDPVRHTTSPEIFTMDSDSDFSIKFSKEAVVMTGASAVAAELLKPVNILQQPNEQLMALAKECFTATRLRWPTVIAPRLKLAVVEPRSLRVFDL